MIHSVIAYKGGRNLPMGIDRMGRIQKSSDHRVQYIKVHEGRDISFYIAGLQLAGVTFEYLPSEEEVLYTITRLRGLGNFDYPVRPDCTFFQVYSPKTDVIVLETGTPKWAIARYLYKRQVYEGILPPVERIKLEVEAVLAQHSRHFELEEHF
jgi:hypothetical protein